MFKKSSWEHLRIPFSYYLMPVYWFALSTVPETEPFRGAMVWVVLHLFLYPSSNGYNSYFDKDEKSIGGLKNPKKVSLDLYYLSLVFFLIALGLALSLGATFFWLVLVYGLVSMAYSHPSIRLKKYPYISWLTAGFFQGAFTFWMCVEGLANPVPGWPLPESLWMPATLTSILLLGSYPLTQVYQHEEDEKRGDHTLSLKLGVSGTFGFSSIWLLVGGIAFAAYFYHMNQPWAVWVFLLAMLPVVLYFSIWFFLAEKDPNTYISHGMSMWMNKISATALNVFFVYLVWQSQTAML